MRRFLFIPLVLWACGRPDSANPLIEAPVIGVERLLRLGSIEGGDDSFAPITDLAVTSRGDRVIVLENQTRLLKFFNSEGTLVKVAGGSGGGPGEFGNPMAVGVFKDTVWVADAMSYRYSLYSPDGELLGDFRPTILASQSLEDRPPRPSVMLDDGRLSGSISLPSRDIAMGLIKTAPVLLMDRKGSVLDTILWRPLGNTAWMIQPDPPDPRRGEMHTRQPFGPRWPYLVSGARGTVYRVAEEPSTGAFLEATDLSGNRLFRTPLDWRGPEVTERDVESVLEPLSEYISQTPIGTGVPRSTLLDWLEASLYVPERLTPVSEILPNSNGDIWLLLPSAAMDEPSRWRVYDPHGQIRYDVEVPAGIKIYEVRDNVLWGVEHDELDVSYVVKLKVNRE